MITTETKLTSIEDIIKVLMEENNFVLTFHINPDYDAVSSSLALKYILEKMGKTNVTVVSEEKKEVFQKIFSFLPYYQEIKELKDIKDINFKEHVLIVLDSGEIKRIGKNFQNYTKEFKFIVNIDHHHDNEMFGKYNLVNPNTVGTGEIIYNILKQTNIPLSKELATLIYASIVGDSGSFRFDSVKPTTHRIAAELLETGIKPSFFTSNMVQNKTIEFMKFEAELLQNIKTCCENKVAWIRITEELLKKYNILESETESIIEDIGKIKDTIVYFAIKEKKEKEIISVALRSKREFDVSEIARKLGGGGHKNASGVSFDISLGIEEVEKIITKEICNHIKLYEK